MGEAVVIACSGAAVLGLIGLAGYVYDRWRRTPAVDSRRSDEQQRRADGRMRYYRDVGDSSKGGY